MDTDARATIPKAPGSPSLFVRYWPIWSFVAVMVFCGGFSFVREPIRAYQIGKRLAADIPLARAAGVPLSASDIKPKKVPDSENAGPQLIASEKLLAKGQESEVLNSTYLPSPNYMFPDDKETVRRALALAMAASQKSACDFGNDLDQGATADYSGAFGFTRLIRNLCFEAVARSKKGDENLALQNLSAATALCDFFPNPSIEVLQNLDAARQTTLMTMEIVMGDHPSDTATLEKIGALAARMDKDRYMEALRGQAYIEIATARNVEQLQYRSGAQINTSIPSDLLVRGPIPPSSRARDLTDKQLKSWTTLFNNLKTATPSTRSMRIVDFESQHVADVGWYDSISSPLMNASYTSTYQKEQITGTLAKSMEGLAAVLQYKATHGDYPKRLSDATGKDLVDNFDGKNMRYKITGDGVRVYGFGPWGRDAGGYRYSELGAPKGHYNIGASYPPFKRDTKSGAAATLIP